MSVQEFKDLYWSPLCETDSSAYKCYLSALNYGFRLIKIGGVDGAAEFLRSERSRIGYDLCDKFADFGDGFAGTSSLVDGVAFAGSTVDAKDNGNCGFVATRFTKCSCRLSASGSGGGISDSFDVGGDGCDKQESKLSFDSSVDGRTLVADRFGKDKYEDEIVVNKQEEEHVKSHVGFSEFAGNGDLVEVQEEKKNANVKGRWHEHNRRKRLAAKEKKKKIALENGDLRSVKSKNWRVRDSADEVSSGGKNQEIKKELGSLRNSLEERWIAENKLAKHRAQRALELAEKVDFQDQLKRAATKLRLETERNMVGIEKTHATLRATGNIPGVVGSVETILDTTISPDSSASMQEFRRVQKQCLDLQEKIERMEKKFGVDSDDLDFLDKKTYTDTSENHRKLLKYVPGDFGIIPVGEGDDGKNYFKVEILGGDVY